MQTLIFLVSLLITINANTQELCRQLFNNLTVNDVTASQIGPAEYREIYRRLRADAERVREEGDIWGIDSGRNPDARPYEDDFGDLIVPFKNFGTWLLDRKSHGLPTHTLDLFGSGIPTKEMRAIDSITGVRLLKKQGTILDLGNNHVVLGEDIFSQSAWRKIAVHLENRNIKLLDLITIRPAGAFLKLQSELGGHLQEVHPTLTRKPKLLRAFQNLYFKVVRNAWELLSTNGGAIFVQLPMDEPYPQYYQKWVALLAANGIRAELTVDGANMKIVKTDTSAQILPILE